MRFATLNCLLLAVAGAGAVSCGPAGGSAPAEAPAHSHADHSHEGQPTEGGPPAAPTADSSGLTATFSSENERTAYEKARPVFETYCGSCHKSGGAKSSPKAQDHFNMDTYPFGGHHAGEITATIRRSLGATGSPPTMPLDKPGALNGDTLGAILFWADNYDRAHASAQKSPTHDDHGHKH